MIAGAGVGIAGGGAGMLRTRRKDISIKPNRKLDRKSSRVMLFENEELRLRTIHINAEVEQGQNDIKKLRRENEQLRREIWSLRDEYDKLEEILKKQKSREESDDLEDRSEDEANGSDYWDEDEEEDNEEDVEDEEFDTVEDDAEDRNQEERLENAENQKISSEKINSTFPAQHRSRINFDDLSVVDEEEEPKKEKGKKEDSLIMQSSLTDSVRQVSIPQSNQFKYCTTSFDKMDPLTTTSFGYQSDCAFVFPNTEPSSGYSNIAPADRNCLLMTPGLQLYPDCSNQQSITSASSLAMPNLNANLDVDKHNHPNVLHGAIPPPPPGWQGNLTTLPTCGTSITKFPFLTKTESLSFDTCVLSSKNSSVQSPENTGSEENKQLESVSNSKVTIASTLTERRKTFFKHNTDTLPSYGPRRINNGYSNTLDKAFENCNYEKQKKIEKAIDDEPVMNEETVKSDISTSTNTPKHFFAPLFTKTKFSYVEETDAKSTDNNIKSRNSDNGNSSSSKKTVSTVMSTSQYNSDKKGSADICVSGAIPYNETNQIEKGDAKAFFSSENLFIAGDIINNESSNGSSNPLTKSISCQDLSTRVSFTENFKNFNDYNNHAKSENTLDNMSLSAKAFKSQLNITLKPCKSPSPEISEIPKLPSIDYKLFNNPFLQNFEQAYQNFPVRTEGQSPVTHPLSIQVSETLVSGTKYCSPVRMQPSFTGPSTLDANCGTCKRKNFEHLRLIIPPAKLLNKQGERQEYHVTSFETPSPRTVQVPPMTPYEIDSLRAMPTGTDPIQQNSRLYQNVPFVPIGATVYCPGQGMRMYYDTVSMKVPVQTQTSIEDEAVATSAETHLKSISVVTESSQTTSDTCKKRRSCKKSGSVKEKRKSQGSQKNKDRIIKHTSVTSKDAIESQLKFNAKSHGSEIHDDKNESRSSSSGQESPKKDQTKRVSLYFNTKKRPSLSSVGTSRSRSVENTKERNFMKDEMLEGNVTNSERERANSISSREAGMREKMRKASTSSGNVPWCACWGNGCL